jgi:hypothetical protein
MSAFGRKKKAPDVTGAQIVEPRMLKLRQSVSCRH